MHGGKRSGAGRKRGIQNKVNAALHEKLVAYGIAPIDFMPHAMRDEHQDLAVRLEMAKAAAPYLYPRRQQRSRPPRMGPRPHGVSKCAS